MRRRKEPALVEPERLRRFVPEDWSSDREEAARLWGAARSEWMWAHAEEVNGVDFINHTRNERRRVLYGIDPPPPMPRSRRRR